MSGKATLSVTHERQVNRAGTGPEGAEIGNQLLESATVAGEVVTADHGQGRPAALASSFEPASQLAKDSSRWATCGVGQQVRVVPAQTPGRRVEPVTLLGDGERHDMRARTAQPVDQLSRLRTGKEHLANGADHSYFRVAFAALEDTVKAVLRQKRSGHGRAALSDTTNPPGIASPRR